MSDGPALVGRTLADRYRIEAELARGGMANVYRARDLRLDREVAVKVLAARHAGDPAFTARFLDEARAAASLSHPSLVHVYDSGSDGSSHYIVMELLDRHRTLRDRLAAEGPLPPAEVLGIGRELLGGLRAVHDRGLVHCDVTPANVMLGPGPAKLIDFGIASRPHDGNDDDTSIGSLRFMSPEQLHGEALTPASDLFSLGAVLYDALTGRPPYAGETPEEISAAQAAGRPTRAVHARRWGSRPPGRGDPPGAAEGSGRSLHQRRRDGGLAGGVGRRHREPVQATTPPRSFASSHGHHRGRRATCRLPLLPRRRPIFPRRAEAGPPRRRSAWGPLGTLLVLGAAALVVVLVVVPLLELGREGGGGRTSPTAAPTREPGSNVVVVPRLVGDVHGRCAGGGPRVGPRLDAVLQRGR